MTPAPRRTPADEPLARARLPRHPTPKILAAFLRDVANRLEHDGRRALDVASIVAPRGWPGAVVGDGRRSADSSSSVERAEENPGRYADADYTLARRLRLLWATAAQTDTQIADLIAHADRTDLAPIGTGACVACGHVCRPTDNPHDRLRAGLCDPCRKAWDRASRPERGSWIITRRRELDGRDPPKWGHDETPGHDEDP